MNEAIEADYAKKYFEANIVLHRTNERISRNRNQESLIEALYNKATL